MCDDVGKPWSRKTVGFDGSASTDPDGGPVYFRWDFDDGASGTSNYSSAEHPRHDFTSQGTYEVALTVVDDEGSTEVGRMVVLVGEGTVPPDPPAVAEEEVSEDDDDGGGGGCYTSPGSGRSGGDPSLLLALASVFVFLALHSRRTRATGTTAGA